MLTRPMGMFNRRIAGSLAVLFILSMLSPAWAIQVGGLGLNQTDNTTTDVIVGHNNKGPYPLSWKNFDSSSVSVVINGRQLFKGREYNIDFGKGTITFDSVLVNDAIVRVSYRVIPGKSQRSNQQSSIPVTLNLLSANNTNVKVTGLFSQNDPNNPNAGKTVVGIGGDKAWSSSNLSTMLLVSQQNDPKTGNAQGGTWDRTAVKLGGGTSLGAMKFTGSYLKSGKDFAGANEYGTGVGKQITDLGMDFAPNKILHASARFQDTADSAGNTAGNRSTTNEQKLIFTPGTTTQLSLLHTTVDSATAAAGSDKNVDTSSMRLDQKIGLKTTALATFESTSINAGSNKDQIQSSGFQINSNAVNRMSLRAAVAMKQSQLLGKEQAMNFGATANPLKQLNLDMNYATLSNDNVGNQATTNLKLVANPVQQVAIQAAYSGVDSTKLGTTSNANVALQASPVKNVQIKANLVDNKKNENEQFQRDFSFSSTPAQYARISAMLSQRGTLNNSTNWDDVTKGASLELTPFSSLKLGAGYKYIEAGTRIMEIKDYIAASQLWNLLSINGSYRDRTLKEDEIPDSLSVKLSLSPVKFFTLTGDYKDNPEDNQGAIQSYNSTAVGLTTHVGSVNLLTNYAQKTEYQASRFSDERNVGLELPMFGHGKLSTSYKMSRFLTSSQLLSNTYTLGYQHSVGADFVLSLNGYYTQWLQDKMMLKDKTEYHAEANLGLKF